MSPLHSLSMMGEMVGCGPSFTLGSKSKQKCSLRQIKPLLLIPLLSLCFLALGKEVFSIFLFKFNIIMPDRIPSPFQNKNDTCG